MRYVIELIKNKTAAHALSILENTNKRAARILLKILKSSLANAKVKKIDTEKLFVSDIRADGGPIMKRMMPRSMGRADRILKRTSHISLKLTDQKTRNAENK